MTQFGGPARATEPPAPGASKQTSEIQAMGRPFHNGGQPLTY